MRGLLKLMVVALVPVLGLTACEKKSDAAPASTYTLTPESNAKFLADFAKRPGVIKLPDGLMYRVLQSGSGPTVQKGSDVVTVYYRGALINGKVFDQTKPDEPRQFPAGALIPGWVEALGKMKTGDMWEIVIPSALGYGEDGAGDAVPPDQTLVFTMKLVKVEYAP
ncbi:MAG TPA: FKBP-type peptidyl-prolyl cis-trans isomerase [Rhizomicrobium sp.]|jgi:FKBP-type peptidyl-prolyl cis-trans isomerase|nr:FKBP-type peptidyl-prolyl cis-trans isomerase [Rhizomicrobium sp.]